MSTHYDLIAIGGGSGGLSVAEKAASYGKKCAVIEPDKLGGTCVNRGCVPKKVMWYAAHLNQSIALSKSYGFDVETKSFNWNSLVESRENYIRGINDWYNNYLSDSNIDLIAGYAKFVNSKTIEVNGTHYSADHIAISTGGTPVIPDIPGAEHGITSDGFFELQTQPQRVVIVGSGYIAVEIAGVLNALGSEVNLLLRGKQILGRFDSLMRDCLTEEMIESGVNILPNISLSAIHKAQNNKLTITASQGIEISDVDALIWAIGRKPLTDDLNLAAVELETDQNGFLPCDEFQNTKQPGVYALGDITGCADASGSGCWTTFGRSFI